MEQRCYAIFMKSGSFRIEKGFIKYFRNWKRWMAAIKIYKLTSF